MSKRKVSGSGGAVCTHIETLEHRRLLSATATTTALALGSTSTVFGQSVSLTATVTAKSGTPGGTVTFKNGSTTLGTAAVNIKTHQAVFSTTSLPVGTDSLSVIYGGATGFAASTSATAKETVAKDAADITLALSSGSVTLAQSLTLNVAVTAKSPGSGTPTGTITFKNGSTTLGTATLGSSAKAVLTEYSWFTGAYNITASYGGDGHFNAATTSAAKPSIATPKYTKASDGLQSAIVSTGSGATAKTGQLVEVDYTGYLTNGTKFDSSLNAGRTPFTFGLGEGSVIAGWDQGVAGMKVGETRVLDIPPGLGYGSTADGSIPANSTLIFVIKLLATDLPRLAVYGGKSYAIAMANGQAASTTAGTSFINEKVGTATAAASFALTSTDQGFDLELTGNPFVKITGADAGDFVLTEPTSADGFVFTLAFKPKAKGVRTAIVSIDSNDPDVPVFTFNLSGTGL